MATGDYVYVLTDDDDEDTLNPVLGAWVRRYEAVRAIEKNIPEGTRSLYTVTTVRFGIVVNEESAYHFLERVRA